MRPTVYHIIQAAAHNVVGAGHAVQIVRSCTIAIDSIRQSIANTDLASVNQLEELYIVTEGVGEADDDTVVAFVQILNDRVGWIFQQVEVVALAANQPIDALATEELVVARPAIEGVIAGQP